MLMQRLTLCASLCLPTNICNIFGNSKWVLCSPYLLMINCFFETCQEVYIKDLWLQIGLINYVFLWTLLFSRTIMINNKGFPENVMYSYYDKNYCRIKYINTKFHYKNHQKILIFQKILFFLQEKFTVFP